MASSKTSHSKKEKIILELCGVKSNGQRVRCDHSVEWTLEEGEFIKVGFCAEERCNLYVLRALHPLLSLKQKLKQWKAHSSCNLFEGLMGEHPLSPGRLLWKKSMKSCGPEQTA